MNDGGDSSGARRRKEATGIGQSQMMKNPIDRPFRSKEELELEQALVSQYRQLGNPELREAVAATHRSDETETTEH